MREPYTTTNASPSGFIPASNAQPSKNDSKLFQSFMVESSFRWPVGSATHQPRFRRCLENPARRPSSGFIEQVDLAEGCAVSSDTKYAGWGPRVSAESRQ